MYFGIWGFCNLDISGKRMKYLDIAKGIGILLVVIGHCIPDASTPNGVSIISYKILFDLIYSFHMPLFFFISGYMISREKMFSRGQTVSDVLRKRFYRLIVPYIVVGLCYAPFKMLLSQFANKPYDINNLWMIVIGVNPDGELWFLYSLFVVHLISAILGFRVSRIGLLVSVAFCVTGAVFPIVTKFIFFFLLGIYVRSEYPDFVINLSGVWVVVAAAFFLIGNYCAIFLRISNMFLFTAVSGIILTLWCSYYLSSMKCKLVFLLDLLGTFSMDIYIFSDIIKIPFRIILWNKMHLYTMSFLICTVVSIVLPVLISKHIIRKNKWLSKVFLGN